MMDWSSIIVGALALCGTLIGSLAGIRASDKVAKLRMDRLEKKVDLHNNAVERLTKAEGHMEVLEEKIKVANHRIDDLEVLEHEFAHKE